MNKFRPLLIIALLLAPAWAQGPPSSQRLEAAKTQATQYGSHIAYAQLRMLENKLGLDPKKSQGYYRLSTTNLLTDFSGGLPTNNSRTRGDLDLITGKRAIEESLQTSSVSSRQTDSKQRDISISEIESLKIKSHPWSQMIKKVGEGPKRPDILRLVPADHFMVFAEGGGTFKKIEDSLKQLTEGAGSLFEIEEKLKVREQVSKRLGIGNFRDLEALINRSVFVSEDLDFYPNTHYALILDADPLIRATATMFLVNTPWQAKVEDYLVLSTSKELLDRIKDTHAGKRPNMRESLDFRYANAVLESRRDALVYLSEEFILKLVGPKYRINAARRIAASEKLSALQYTVLAYRTLGENWPTSFQQMVDEGYIFEADDETYSIDSKGIVSHKVWGSLYDIRALSEVPITQVSEREKESYDGFREGYQSFWREFFDPVGMSVAVNERLSVHTIILPLIDNGDYRRLQLLTGGKPVEFEANSKGLAGFPIRLHSRFNFDEALLNFLSRRSRDQKSIEERKSNVNQEFQKWLNLNEPISVFDMIGDEAAVSFGSEYRLSDRFDDSQVVLSFKLKDQERFQKISRLILSTIGAETREPELRSHLGQEYVSYGDGERNHLCALYSDGFVHVTFNESAIKVVCEAMTNQDRMNKVDWPGMDQTGKEHNILFLAQTQSMNELKQELIHFEDREWVKRQLEQRAGYLWDADLLVKAGVEADFFREVPTSLFGVPVTRSQNRIEVGHLPLSDIDFAYQDEFRRYRKGPQVQRSEAPEDSRVQIATLLEQFHDESRLAKLELFKNLAIGMSFTPEGLSTRVTVNNPAQASLNRAEIRKN